MMRRRLRSGNRMPLASHHGGDVVSALPSSKWKHPWTTTAAWSPRAKRWVATVEPGFVNGTGATGGLSQAPVFRATVAEQQSAGNNWETNPLTGKPFFSDFVFKQPTAEQAALRIVDLPIYLSPAIPLDFYGIGFDGDPTAGVPQFFVDLGAARVPKTLTTEGVDPTPPKNLRLLRACDLWIHQPRLALTSEITLQPGIATGISNVTQTLGVRSPAPSDALRIIQGAFTPFTPFSAGIDPINNDYEEPNFDELLISTVYLLSPPNTAIGSEPDATWTPYVRHNLFWNIEYAQPPFRILSGDPGVPFIPPLAGGAAQLVINFLTASINDATQQALNILQGHSLAGKFWTATGGGSSASVAALVTSQQPKGPDRKANAAAKLAADQADKRRTQLDPDFPYNARPFPLALLSA